MKQCEIKDIDSLIEYSKQSVVLSVENITPPTPPKDAVIDCMKIILFYKTPIAVIIGSKIFSPDYKKYYSMLPTTENNHIRRILRRYNSIILKISLVVTMDAFIEFVYEYLEYKIKQYNQLIIQDFIKRLR